MTPNHTDYFDQPIKVGDPVVYPVAGYAGRASFSRGKIAHIVDLVPHRDTPGTPEKPNYMRADQAGQRHPTVYRYYDVVKHFVVKLEVVALDAAGNPHGQPRTQTIRFVQNLIRVP